MIEDGSGRDGTIQQPVSTIKVEEMSQTSSEVSSEEMSALITETRPEFKEAIDDWIPQHPGSSGSDLLDYLASLETDQGTEPETINVTETYVATLFLDELRDIAFTASDDTHIIIRMNGSIVLDNIYTPSFDGMVHLDLRELVQRNTVNFLPTICPDDDMITDGIVFQYRAHSTVFVSVGYANTGKSYYFTVCGFESGAQERCTDIDFLRIPEDYLLPLSLYLPAPEQAHCNLSHFLESGQRRTLLAEETKPFKATQNYTPGNALIFSRDIPIKAVPARIGEQFRIVQVADGVTPQTILSEGTPLHREIATPMMKICPGEFHQYIFLNRYGHYDNIPMSGAKTYSPEYDIENAEKAYSIDKVRSTMRESYTQNTGPQTRATLEALAELLLSPEIFHYVPGKSIRRIVVENPTLTVNSQNSINTATFSWRYAGK